MEVKFLEKMLTAKEMCEWLGITRVTLKKWCEKGLPVYRGDKLLRFDVEEAKDWLRNNGKNKEDN